MHKPLCAKVIASTNTSRERRFEGYGYSLFNLEICSTAGGDNCSFDNYRMPQSISNSDRGSVTETCGGGKPCQTSGTGSVMITIKNNMVVSGLDPSTLASLSPSDFTTITSLDASNFSPNTSSPAQATLTASTDTGYSSSITVNLQQVASSTPPVNTGDAVHTYAVSDANLGQVTAWLQQVSNNTSSAAQITSVASLPMNSAGNPGTYTLSGQANSNSTGLVSVGSATMTVAPPSNDCGIGGTKCYQQ